MDISTWICVALIGAFVAFPLATWLSSLYPSTTRLLRKWIIVPQIPRKIHLGSIGGRKTSVNVLAEGILTPLHLCVMLALFVPYTVILLSSYKIQRLLIWRTGRILAFTFSFLVISGRQSLFTNSLRISLNFQSFIHRWLGRIVFLCTVIHVVVAFVPNRSSVALLPLRSRIAGFTVSQYHLRASLLISTTLGYVSTIPHPHNFALLFPSNTLRNISLVSPFDVCYHYDSGYSSPGAFESLRVSSYIADCRHINVCPAHRHEDARIHLSTGFRNSSSR